jgi:hypothetical protein
MVGQLEKYVAAADVLAGSGGGAQNVLALPVGQAIG